MKKPLRLIWVLLALLMFFPLAGCQNDNVLQLGDPFTVTFVDKNGNVLDTFDCTVGEACDIVAPTLPADTNVMDTVYFVRWSLWESEWANIQEDTVIHPIYTYSNVAISIGGRDIVFYSVFIMTGIAVALTLAIREAKRIGVKPDDLIDGFLWIVPVAILGARLWYVVFEWNSFFYGNDVFASILRALGFSSGTLDFSSFGLAGLAIHGAFVTAVICAYFYTKKRKIDIFKVLDLVAVGFIIAQAFGRWGNFFNLEAHGPIVGGMTDGVANLSLEEQYNFLRYTLHLPEFIVNNMYLLRGANGLAVEPLTGYYHPTFFYESMANLVGFAIMLVLRRIKKVHFGELLSFYLIWYGTVRIFIELLRTDPLTFELFGITFKSAIVTSSLMIILGVLLSIFVRTKRKGQDYSTVPGFFECKKPSCEPTEDAS
ncbi:MAG: prolipoprotein diacylglyceryl transferase [Candidatus Izemoplasmatales bacterium]|nr:prolipoprotein diacylglyceryl transferase [Candidatus Izemoplasmatales bacterium]